MVIRQEEMRRIEEMISEEKSVCVLGAKGMGKSSFLRKINERYPTRSVYVEYVSLKKNPHCKVCGPTPEITKLVDYFDFCGVPGLEYDEGTAGKEWDITATELSTLLKSGRALQLIDVREPHELEISHINGARNIPLGELATHLSELDSAQEIVLFCKTGSRSRRALELLVCAGFRKVKNLQGGINAWARDVDLELPVY